jgi:hypothetical protein
MAHPQALQSKTQAGALFLPFYFSALRSLA